MDEGGRGEWDGEWAKFSNLSLPGANEEQVEEGTLFYLSRAAGEIEDMVTWVVASCFSRKELLSVRSMGINHSTTKSPVTRAPNSHNSQRFMYPLPGGEETGGTIEVHFAVFSS